MYQACLFHSRAERYLKGLVSTHLGEWGITRMEWLVLATVNDTSRHEEGHTMGEIARILDIRLSQLTSLVNRLNHAGYISQLISEKDKRTKYVRTTLKGSSLIEGIDIAMRTAIKDWLSNIRQDQLASYMQTVIELGSEKRIK